MSFHAEVLAHSVSPAGVELHTVLATYPRLIHSELMTHRQFSRNSSSSRAVPVSRMLRLILEDPFVPEQFGVNEPGMQARRFLEAQLHDEAVQTWLRGRGRAVWTALELLLGQSELERVLGTQYWHERSPFTTPGEIEPVMTALREFEEHVRGARERGEEQTRYLNVHKQSANRVLEPYAWHTTIITATEWSNWDALRISEHAQPEIRKIAELIQRARLSSTPTLLQPGQWHLPLVEASEIAAEQRFSGEEAAEYWCKVSSGRCAAVSYLNHARREPDQDASRTEGLVANGHFSPLEHVATPLPQEEAETFCGNLRGWKQYRKTIAHEHDFSLLES